MPSNHKGHPTIAFRPSTSWQYDLIDKRAWLSGMHKKDFIIRSCIYSNICMVGTKENIQRIVDALQEMQLVMKEIVGQLRADDFLLSNENLREFRNDLLAVSITAVDIVNGAAYLFGKEADRDNQHWKAELELEQFRSILNLEHCKTAGKEGEGEEND